MRKNSLKKYTFVVNVVIGSTHTANLNNTQRPMTLNVISVTSCLKIRSSWKYIKN